MHCYICGLDFNIGFWDGQLLQSENIIDEYDNNLVALSDVFRDMIMIVEDETNFNLSVNDNAMICTMCLVLLKQYHKYQVKLKTMKHLLLKSTYRTNKIHHTNKVFPKIEYERLAMEHFKENKYGSYSCDQCSYRTSYTDTIAPHYLYHKKCNKFEIAANKLLRDDQHQAIEQVLNDREDIEVLSPEISKLENSKSSCEIPFQMKEETPQIINNENDDGSVEYLSSDFDLDCNVDADDKELFGDDDDEELFSLRKAESKELFDDDNDNQQHQKAVHKDIEPEELFDDDKELLGYNENQHYPKAKPIDTEPEDNVEEEIDKNPIVSQMSVQQCLNCDKQLKDKNALHNHMINVHKKCWHCNQIYSTSRYVRKHIKAIHTLIGNAGTSLSKIICDICSEEYSTTATFRTHYQQHTKIEKKYTCEICGSSFCQKISYDEHISLHTNTTNHTCKLCGRKFVRSSAYNLHMRYHDNPRPFKCEYCNNYYTTKSSLAVHKRCHTGEMLYNCEHCDKGFAAKSYYKLHLVSHTKEYPYTCMICDDSDRKGFLRKRDYANHMAKIHNDFSHKSQKQQEFKIALGSVRHLPASNKNNLEM